MILLAACGSSPSKRAPDASAGTGGHIDGSADRDGGTAGFGGGAGALDAATGGAGGQGVGGDDGAAGDGRPDAGVDRSGGDAGACLTGSPTPGPDGGTGGTLGLAGQSCGSPGALACAGAAQKQTLICQAGTWRAFQLCGASQNCDRTSGVCTDIAAGCAGLLPGGSFCAGDVLEVCGPDLVSTSDFSCCGVCTAGACGGAVCGDGKIEGNEECDDGNSIPADGCEPDCKLSRIEQIAAGMTHTCALLREGLVRCWGGNADGQLGLGTTGVVSGQFPYQNPIAMLGAPAIAVATGAEHTCALMQDATVRCWGRNQSGQLGLGNTDDVTLPSAANATVPLGAPAVAIAAGGNVTCAIMQDGSLRCWGQNDYGQLGLGNTDDIGDNEAITSGNSTVILDDTVQAVGPGGDHTCAVMSSNLLRCWGRNDLGQLGLGNTTNISDTAPPTAVAAIDFAGAANFEAIMAGATRTFAWESDGSLRAWGDNSDGGLGYGFIGSVASYPATQLGPFTFEAAIEEMAVGGYHTCVALQNNDLRCWGINDAGQLGLDNTITLGDNGNIDAQPPVDLGLDSRGKPAYAIAIAAGWRHTCALLAGGVTLRCWGYNLDGQLGLGYASTPPAADYVGGTAATVPSLLPAVEVFPPPS